MHAAPKKILKTLLSEYDKTEDKGEFLLLTKINIEELKYDPFINARLSFAQNHYQACRVFLKIKEMKKETNHKARAHALLSASGASRWMACTPSPLLEEDFKEESSFYAEEGTLAHEFADINLRLFNKEMPKRKHTAETKKLKAHKLYSEEMDQFVEVHTDYVKSQFNAAKKITPDAVLLVEARISIEDITGEENAQCTCDSIVISDGVLEVIDLKYGAGIRVSSEDNPQLKLYGLGALNFYDLMYDINTVRLTITQPRMDSISSWEISADDLRKWGTEEVTPRAKEALSGKGEQVVGDHCHYCKAAPKCKAQHDLATKTAVDAFTDKTPQLINDETLTEMYGNIKTVQKWFKSVTDYMYKEAMNGKKWEGLKLVDGRSQRAWTDESKVVEILEKDYNFDAYVTEKLKGIGDIEKLVGKKEFPSLLGEVVGYKKSAPSLVAESDKRPEYGIQSVADDYKDDI